ncbi:hypothetical protein [Phytohabitans rumicis]|uniref:Lipoprotein n=1 Tax=Phytohabitans rumicis TaxID=1076125 RepID=A0A6V8L894_9ACTN|nr:hypothetical protein [Phytohabitans rumicis]GFJ91208.1 hypothetical protein Prum_048500 [Phytohabitans rumicis]
MSRSLRAGAIGLALAATLAACTEPAAEASEPTIGEIRVVRSAADVTLPLDSYALTAEQQRMVTNAIIILGRECLRGFGLDWPASQPAPPADTEPNAQRYPLMDPQKAATGGYHALDLIEGQKEIAERKKDAEAPSQDAMNVWAGRGQTTYNGKAVPRGGCAGEAQRQLYGGKDPVDIEVVQRLGLDAHARMRQDSRVVKVFADWSACVKEQGFDYRDPYAANDDQRWQTEQVTETEIATAVADVGCKTKHNVIGTLLTVETAYQNTAIEEHAPELAAVKTYLADQQTAAARVVAGGGI